MSALRRILDAMIPGSPARAAQTNRVAQIGSAGAMNPNNTMLGKAREMKQYKMLPYKEKVPPLNKPLIKNGFLEEDAGFVGNPRNLNQYSPANADIRNFMPQAEDDYMVSPQFSRISDDVRNWRQSRPFVQSPTSAMQGGVYPMDMDAIPGNNTRGRTGYYQGSNPYLNNLEDDYRLRVR